MFDGKYLAITGDCSFSSDISDLSLQCLSTIESVVFYMDFASSAAIEISESTFLAPEFKEIPAVIDERHRNSLYDEAKESVSYTSNPLTLFYSYLLFSVFVAGTAYCFALLFCMYIRMIFGLYSRGVLLDYVLFRAYEYICFPTSKMLWTNKIIFTRAEIILNRAFVQFADIFAKRFRAFV